MAKMKVTNEQLEGGVIAFGQLMQMDLEFDTSYKVYKTVKVLKPLTEAFEETKKKIGEKFALRDKDGEIITEDTQNGSIFRIDPDKSDECDAEMKKVRAMENEVDVDTVTMKELKASGAKIKGAVLFTLEWYIVDNLHEEPTGAIPPTETAPADAPAAPAPVAP